MSMKGILENNLLYSRKRIKGYKVFLRLVRKNPNLRIRYENDDRRPYPDAILEEKAPNFDNIWLRRSTIKSIRKDLHVIKGLGRFFGE